MYFPCHSKFSPTKPQDSQARATQVDVNIQLVEGLIYSSMETTYRSFPGNKTTPQCFQGQKLSILCLISDVLPGLKLWPFSVCRYHRKWNEERIAVKSSLNSPISLQEAVPWIRIHFILFFFIVLFSDVTLIHLPVKQWWDLDTGKSQQAISWTHSLQSTALFSVSIV